MGKDKKTENKDRMLLTSMWVILAVSFQAFITSIVIVLLVVPEGICQGAVMTGAVVLFLIPCFYALKLEITAGVYKCKKCGREIVPTYREALMAPHYGTTRYLECPACGKRVWCKKTIKKI